MSTRTRRTRSFIALSAVTALAAMSGVPAALAGEPPPCDPKTQKCPPPPPPVVQKSKCNSGNGNGSDIFQTIDPTAHCFGGDPGNSFNAGNKGGDETASPGSVQNPGGNNSP